MNETMKKAAEFAKEANRTERSITKKELEKLVAIAAKNIYPVEARGDLESRGSDEEDFLDIAVWGLKLALIEAYNLGKASK